MWRQTKHGFVVFLHLLIVLGIVFIDGFLLEFRLYLWKKGRRRATLGLFDILFRATPGTVQRHHLGLSCLLVFLQVESRRRRIVKIVRTILVSLSFFEQRVPKPMLDDFRWQATLVGHVVYLLFRRRIVYVKMRAQYFQLIVGYASSCALLIGCCIYRL